jgi:hypothetical protein
MGKLFPYIRKDFVQTAHAMTFIVTLLGSFKYFLVLKLTFTWEPVFPIIIAAPRYFEDLAHLLNREYGAMFLDKKPQAKSIRISQPMLFSSIGQ